MLWISSVLTKVLVRHGLVILWWICQAYSRLDMLVHPLGSGAVHASPALVRGGEGQGAHLTMEVSSMWQVKESMELIDWSGL